MDKDEFEQNYCKESGITLEEYHQLLVTLPCSCGESDCNGWASVTNNEVSIKAHNTLYNKLGDTMGKYKIDFNKLENAEVGEQIKVLISVIKLLDIEFDERVIDTENQYFTKSNKVHLKIDEFKNSE